MLKKLAAIGDKYVRVHFSAETSKVIPIDKMLEITERAIKQFDALRLQGDEFVCLQEDRKAAGIDPIDQWDKFLPVDCGNCGAFFSVNEAIYRQWRSGEIPDMLCPHCHCVFQEGRWRYVRCKTCGAYSGTMPLSLCEHLKKSEVGWRCRRCAKSDAQVKVQKMLKKYTTNAPPVGPSGKPRSSGCLSVVLISLCVGFLIVLGL
jgi:hypothetical protein